MSLLFDQDEIMRIHDVNLEAEVRKDEREKTKKTEQENGIRALVETCRDFGATITDTVARVASKFGLTEQDAVIQVRKYW